MCIKVVELHISTQPMWIYIPPFVNYIAFNKTHLIRCETNKQVSSSSSSLLSICLWIHIYKHEMLRIVNGLIMLW